MTTINVNSDFQPVNIVTVVGDVRHPTEHEAIVRFLEALRAFADKRQVYANIVDLTQCGILLPVERQFIGDSFNEHRELYRQYLAGVAVILRSPVVRGALTAIGWIHPYPSPIEFVADFPQAEIKASKLLAKRGVTWSGFGDRLPFAKSVGRR
ncbi:MAG TPA: hypothetical protein VIV60_34645 [Polyangiaceae bacterium]